MNEELVKNIKRFFLLEENVKKIDSSGLTNIFLKTKEEFYELDKIHKEQNFTPIEQIMDCILISVTNDLQRIFNNNVLFYFSQYVIENYRVDFCCCFVDDCSKKYVIECDGHDFHEKTKEQAIYDKKRERELIGFGYNVLRYSGSEIINNFIGVRQELFDFFYNEYKKLKKENKND